MTLMSPADETPTQRKPKATMYANRGKAYPRFLNGGLFRRVKWLATLVTLAVFWISPWIRWDRGLGAPDQAILIDLPGRRAYFFFIEIWPQEVYYLTGLLIIAALLLFFVSALLGRVWCGFACWQTVFTDVFVWIERMFQGERNQRMALDKQPWTLGKLARKLATHAGWIIVSVGFGYGFVLYFDDAPAATRALLTGGASLTQYGTVALMSVFPYLLAGYARENVCIYMCPYARFQAAMFDEHSMIVSYESWRGEPRAMLKGKPDFTKQGHCVDCKMCIQVCPTGIDIRNGSQLACIGCALCIDACDSVMDRFGLPRGLLTYDSVFNQQARAVGNTSQRTKLLRPRVYIYLAIITLVASVMVYSFSTRKSFDVTALHERSPVYVELSGNRLRNGYTIKVLNMVRKQGRFKLTVEGVRDATLNVIGIDGEGLKEVELPVSPDSVGTFHVFVTAPRASLDGKAVPMTVSVADEDNGKVETHRNLFAGPDAE